MKIILKMPTLPKLRRAKVSIKIQITINKAGRKNPGLLPGSGIAIEI
jgi:hypothetical protein